MYVLLLAGGLALSIIVSLLVFPEKPAFILGPFLGLIAFVVPVFVLSRKIAEKVRPFFEAAQRQAQTGNVAQAIQSLDGALAWRRWQLFLEQQVNTEVGLLLYAQGDEKKAIERLRRGYPKVSTGHLVLGAMLYRGGSLEEARAALEHGIRYNKKSPILYNVLAWLLAKEGQRQAAMDVLARALKADPADEPTADNLGRLQNDKRMNMKPFGDLWFMLKFETPKGMTVAGAPFRKGFRQPPKAGKRSR
ncbi:MAG: hypothetical protein M9894_02285 [Planctomycetes bacterium]|nr:hypothetical protein [Planctomycetota bacterium]